MFHLQPATAAKDAFDRLHLFMREAPTPFDLRRLELDAARLEKASPSEAYTIRAAIAALNWDIPNAESWSAKACIVDGDPIVRLNASLTFRYLNQLATSAEYALASHRQAPLDETGTMHCVSVLCSAGRIQEANRVFAEYQQRTGKEDAMTLDTDSLLRFITECDLSEEQLQVEIAAAMEVLTEERIRHESVEFEEALEPDGGSALVARVRFRGDIATELRLESKLAHRLVEMPTWNPALLSVEFEYIPTESHVRIAA